MTLTKHRKDLYDKNFTSLKKEIEIDIRRWNYLPCSWISRTNTAKISIILKAINRFSAIPIRTLTHFFTDLQRKILNFIWKNKNPGYPRQSCK